MTRGAPSPAFIRNVRDNGKTVIFSTHIMSEVEKRDTIGIIMMENFSPKAP